MEHFNEHWKTTWHFVAPDDNFIPSRLFTRDVPSLVLQIMLTQSVKLSGVLPVDGGA